MEVSSVPKGPSETEDCLYLDVLVPKKIFDRRYARGSKAPVVVWIYGGGFVLGGKTQNGDGSGLIAESTNDPRDEGVIFVAFNYRVRTVPLCLRFGTDMDNSLVPMAGSAGATFRSKVVLPTLAFSINALPSNGSSRTFESLVVIHTVSLSLESLEARPPSASI